MAQTACMSACKHLSTSLLQLLLEADVRQVSMGALQQFNVDVKECESKFKFIILLKPDCMIVLHPGVAQLKISRILLETFN